MRLGWHALLSGLSHDYEVVSADIEDIEKLANVACPADLAVLSLPAGPYASHEAMAIVQYFLQPGRMLLLAEPSAPGTREASSSVPSVYACIEKNTPMETFMAAVRFGTSDDVEHYRRMDACPQKGPWPLSTAVIDPISEGNATHASPVAGQDHEQSRAVHDIDAPEQLADVLAPKAAPPLPLDYKSKANIRHDNRLRLTPRQHEVLALLARGYPIKKVARMLNISPSTAKGHTASLYRQLKVNSKDEAVYIAHHLGILLH